MSTQLRPAGITLNRRTAALEIKWNDGHLSAYPLRDLREACPCAECRSQNQVGAGQTDSNVLRLGRARDYNAQSVELVGNYALQVEWGDGHRTGIYTWPYLRDLCPCGEHTSRASGDEAPDG